MNKFSLQNPHYLVSGIQVNTDTGSEGFQKNIKSKKRFHEMGVAQLLAAQGIDIDRLSKKKNGQPFLSGYKEQISISHHAQWVFIQMAKENFSPGIDIEKAAERVAHVAERFLHPKEKTWVESDNLFALTKIWCIKEAIYKSFAEGSISFRNQIEVLPIFPADRQFKAILTLPHQQIEYLLHWEALPAHCVLVWVHDYAILPK